MTSVLTQTGRGAGTVLAAVAVGMVFSASGYAITIPLTVDPGAVNSVIAAAVEVDSDDLIGLEVNGSTLELDIVFTDMKHIEGGDNDFELRVQLFTDSNAPGGLLESPSGFLSDMNHASVLDSNINSGEIGGGGVVPTGAPLFYSTAYDMLPDGLIFHDVHFSVDLPDLGGATVTDAFIGLFSNDGGHTIGEWTPAAGAVPEPVSAGLGLMGLAGLATATRRRGA